MKNLVQISVCSFVGSEVRILYFTKKIEFYPFIVCEKLICL